jgi:hypothetical protein
VRHKLNGHGDGDAEVDEREGVELAACEKHAPVHLVVRVQVEKVTAVSHSKSNSAWI